MINKSVRTVSVCVFTLLFIACYNMLTSPCHFNRTSTALLVSSVFCMVDKIIGVALNKKQYLQPQIK